MSLPIPYQTSLEQPGRDEAETIDSLLASLDHIAQKVFEDEGHAYRSVHAKSHGLLRGELRVMRELPPYLAQGLFAVSQAHPVMIRLSTSPGDLLDDDVSTPRGLALKVFEVDGERLPGSEALHTQDFVMVNGPAFLKPDAKHFARSLKQLATTTDKVPGLKKVLSAALRGAERIVESAGRESPTLKSLGGEPATHILGDTFFSQTPFLYGPYMAKFSMAPVSENLLSLRDVRVALKGRPNALREVVVEFFRNNDAEWDLQVQLCNDLEKMPIEDASIPWPEEVSPFVPVARVIVARQDAWHSPESERLDDRLAFSPWQGLAAHRPLGSMNRARRAAYEASAAFRGERNGCPMQY